MIKRARLLFGFFSLVALITNTAVGSHRRALRGISLKVLTRPGSSRSSSVIKEVSRKQR